MITNTLRIGVGADHGAVEIKDAVRDALRGVGHEVVDFGTDSSDAVDYSDFANQVARGVAEDYFDFGVLVCKSGIGMSIAANRVRGVRAAKVNSAEEAEVTRRHNDTNIICLGAMSATPEEAVEWAGIFLATEFEGGRHARRVNKAGGSPLALVDPEVAAAIAGEEKPSIPLRIKTWLQSFWVARCLTSKVRIDESLSQNG